MTAILGISAYYHDSAAALVVDGDVVAAVQEERLTRCKHDAGFPSNAIEYCLREARLDASELDAVGFYEKPFLKFDRLMETYLAFVPRGFRSFGAAMPQWLHGKLRLRRELREGLDGKYLKRFVFAEHHQSHAASAFYPSPFDEAAILTVDAVGEWSTASFGVGRGNRIELAQELSFPHSLGLLYSAFTYFCGFRVNSGEYKLMGLAPYGTPRFADLIRERLMDIKADGSFRMNMRYFNYCQGLTMTNRRFAKLFGGRPRRPESPITQREMDLAASVQLVIEDVLLRMVRHVYRQTGLKCLCMAGGVALNCVANGRILREGPFGSLWIQPAAGDAGGALGVALLIWHQLMNHPRVANPEDSLRGSLLGPAFPNSEIVELLRSEKAAYQEFASDEQLVDRVAELLAEGNVVGWFQGRMEFGPRALGNRSILADPRDPNMQDVLNGKIKFRESFRPFAPAVLQEKVSDYFAVPPEFSSPYMLLVTSVKAARDSQPTSGDFPTTRGNTESIATVDNETDPRDGAIESVRSGTNDQASVFRSSLPAVTHVDGSARVQTVDRQRNPLLHRLLIAFERKTGCAVLVNTSFNVRGEPIVCTPRDAYRCFLATGMDVLVLGRYVLRKRL